MNILFLHTYPGWGGGEVSLTAISEGLAGRGHHITIVCRPDSALHRRAAALHSVLVPLRIAGDFDPFTIWMIARLIARQRIDVVCVHTSKELRVGGTAASLARVPIVISQEIDLPLKNTWLNRFFYARIVSAVMVNSIATRNTLLASVPWLPHDKVSVVLKGIDVQPFRSARPVDLRKEFQLDQDSVIAGFVGRLDDAQKGVTTLLEAMALAVRRDNKVRLVVAGEGPLKEEIATLCRDRGLSRSVVFAGFRDDIPAFMNGIDLLVMPSNFEGFGYSAAEAMAAGKPVIATNVSSLPEIIEDGKTGVLVPPRDPEKLAEAILALAADPARRASLGRAGALRVERDFALDSMLDKVEDMLVQAQAQGSWLKPPWPNG